MSSTMSIPDDRTDERSQLIGGGPGTIQKADHPDADPSRGVGVGVKRSRLPGVNLVVCVCLWLTYLICSMAYSIIAPFFPKEVRAARPQMYEWTCFRGSLVLLCLGRLGTRLVFRG